MEATVIRKYKGRKMFSKELGSVYLSDIRDLVRSGKTVQVIEHETGTDITAKVLAQVLAGMENVPASDLQNLIRERA